MVNRKNNILKIAILYNQSNFLQTESTINDKYNEWKITEIVMESI